MKTMMMKRMCCCCCSSMRMMRNDKEGRDQHIINIYKERQEHEKISIHHSIALRAAS
jgi:hypothetical protein